MTGVLTLEPLQKDINVRKYCMCKTAGSTELEGNNTDFEDMGHSKQTKCSKDFPVGTSKAALEPKHQTLKLCWKHGSKVPHILHLNTRTGAGVINHLLRHSISLYPDALTSATLTVVYTLCFRTMSMKQDI
jgi:hypothetical protein